MGTAGGCALIVPVVIMANGPFSDEVLFHGLGSCYDVRFGIRAGP